MSAEYQLLSPHYSFTQAKLVSPLVSRNVQPVTFSFFHQKLADLITDGCRKIRKKTKCNCVALSGGVFQNRLLLRMVEEGLEKEHFTVLRHHLIPANDGGIALGQAAYAMQYIQEGK